MKKYDLKQGEQVTINWRAFKRLGIYRDENSIQVDKIDIVNYMQDNSFYKYNNVFTIEKVSKEGRLHFCELKEDKHGWYWPPAMLLRVGPKRLVKIRKAQLKAITI